ncbi:MAG: polysaccharide biosynthesis C-terminal domain-containing protein [Lachnospiraceae bacterium]|nr:polysaccharide biosynthesis C-terminal domain-containing protein [Lachnospiraceae bacterium]
MSEKKLFTKYVSQNILGMLGISVYILADTFFISLAEGADGITALNLVLPVYSLIFAVGAMIGVGSAIRFKILRARNDREAEMYFSNALLWALMIGILFILIGVLMPEKLVALLGGDDRIVAVGKDYTAIFMMFAPFFMWNHICNAFVRNDGAPSVAMAATLCSSLFNVVFDYVLMFPLRLGMRGAALATALSPVLGVAICSVHLLSKKSTITVRWTVPSARRLFAACQLGISAFVGEISSGVTTVVFNMIILRLAGNVGVAAYGVVANTSLVAAAVFNGVSQGSQPLLSDYYGRGQTDSVRKVVKLGVGAALGLALLILGMVCALAEPITAVFNHEENAALTAYAVTGLRLYFIGFLFAGFNIVGTGILSAVESARWAFAASISRGFVSIIVCAFVLSAALGMNGVWLAFPAAELLTAALVLAALRKSV